VIPLGSTAGALSSARWETLSFRPMGLPESRAADVPYRSVLHRHTGGLPGDPLVAAAAVNVGIPAKIGR
jgi:hypothetical protein